MSDPCCFTGCKHTVDELCQGKNTQGLWAILFPNAKKSPGKSKQSPRISMESTVKAYSKLQIYMYVDSGMWKVALDFFFFLPQRFCPQKEDLWQYVDLWENTLLSTEMVGKKAVNASTSLNTINIAENLQSIHQLCIFPQCITSGGGTVWAMWASGPPTFLTVWAWPTHFWHYFLLLLFCLSPLIIDFFQDWPTHFQNRSAAAVTVYNSTARFTLIHTNWHKYLLFCEAQTWISIHGTMQ